VFGVPVAHPLSAILLPPFPIILSSPDTIVPALAALITLALLGRCFLV
jgi:hypothetical protein